MTENRHFSLHILSISSPYLLSINVYNQPPTHTASIHSSTYRRTKIISEEDFPLGLPLCLSISIISPLTHASSIDYSTYRQSTNYPKKPSPPEGSTVILLTAFRRSRRSRHVSASANPICNFAERFFSRY